MRIRLLMLVAAAVLAVSSTGEFAISSAADPGNTRAEMQRDGTSMPVPVDGVTIEAHKERLFQLRRAIESSVGRFFETFNQLNTVPGYETHCSDETPTGTHIRKYVCTPRFVEDATENATQGFLNDHAAIPASAVVSLRMPAYKKHLRDLIAKEPRLREALHGFDALVERYEVVRREKVRAQ